MSIMGRPENILGTSRISLSVTSLGRQIRTSPGRQIRTSTGRQTRTSLERQIVTSPGWSNRIFRECPGNVGGGRPQNILGTNICQLGSGLSSAEGCSKCISSINLYLSNKILLTASFLLWPLKNITH